MLALWIYIFYFQGWRRCPSGTEKEKDVKKETKSKGEEPYCSVSVSDCII